MLIFRANFLYDSLLLSVPTVCMREVLWWVQTSCIRSRVLCSFFWPAYTMYWPHCSALRSVDTTQTELSDLIPCLGKLCSLEVSLGEIMSWLLLNDLRVDYYICRPRYCDIVSEVTGELCCPKMNCSVKCSLGLYYSLIFLYKISLVRI